MGKQDLSRRINSATSISQITKAMEAVAASKMKKAAINAGRSEEYRNLLWSISQRIRRSNKMTRSHPFLTAPRAGLPQLTIIISSDRGLCGPLNTNLLRLIEANLDPNAPVMVIGKKATAYAKKTRWQVSGTLEKLGDQPSYQEVKALSTLATSEFLAHRVGSVFVAYQRFVNTLTQQLTLEKLLPISDPLPELPTLEPETPYLFEPPEEDILEELLPYAVHINLYHAVLSAKAAEQSARMIAMKNASDNADDVSQHLALLYNRERQATITAQIADIVTASMAITT